MLDLHYLTVSEMSSLYQSLNSAGSLQFCSHDLKGVTAAAAYTCLPSSIHMSSQEIESTSIRGQAEQFFRQVH